MTPQEFIKLLSDKIDKIKDFPVLKSLAIAQSCLESRYGEKSFYGNIFGIKLISTRNFLSAKVKAEIQ